VRQIRGKCRRLTRGYVRLVLATALIPLLSGCGLLGGLSNTRLSSPESLIVTSPVFGADIRLPTIYTCHGRGLSPPLQWSGAITPAPKSFAIVVDDSLAPISPYVYWIVFDLSPNTVAIGQNQLPTGARQAENSAGRAGYDAPCPRGKWHEYRFTVYALNSKVRLVNGEGLRATWSAIANHVIASGRLTARAYP
jgi:Raf kinase inhibitor-like YbhB/YbcL family protein